MRVSQFSWHSSLKKNRAHRSSKRTFYESLNAGRQRRSLGDLGERPPRPHRPRLLGHRVREGTSAWRLHQHRQLRRLDREDHLLMNIDADVVEREDTGQTY